jgi:hypothetical protein
MSVRGFDRVFNFDFRGGEVLERVIKLRQKKKMRG